MIRMYDEEKTDELYRHCEKIGVDADLYLELIHNRFGSKREYDSHIEELEKIVRSEEDID